MVKKVASNSFGEIFKITTFGESHGPAIGVVIDGCPAGLSLDIDDINHKLSQRAPGKNDYTSPRNETDAAQILSGVFEGVTTGAPIMIIIYNKDQDSSKYEPIKNLLRPGHANYTYLEKYGIFDYKGGGRSSARETAARVAASVVANKVLEKYNIKILAYIKSIYTQQISLSTDEIISLGLKDFNKINNKIYNSSIFSLDESTENSIKKIISDAKNKGDSVGGVIEFIALNLPVGLGDPVYQKLEARLASAMLSIPATKGFEIGSGFEATNMLGSQHNDEFIVDKDNNISLSSNNSGGTLGGISTGMPLIARVAFKPTSSINKPQQTVDVNAVKKEFKLPEGSRHDPCVTLRAVPVVNAMVKLVLADLILMNNNAKI